MNHNEICRYCGGYIRPGRLNLIHQNARDRKIFFCTNCNAYVTCNDAGEPLGTVANNSLRGLRIKAHNLLKKMQRSRKWNEAQAYDWLAAAMQKSSELTHFGFFEMDECQRAINLMQQALANGKAA